MKRFSYLYVTFLTIFSSCSQQEDKKIPLAILTPITHPSLEEIEKGYKEKIETEHPGKYSFVTYNAQGNKTLMRAEVEEIINKEYPLLFTIGATASQMAKEVFTKKMIAIPLVFTCVSDPIGLEIASTEERPGGNITGVKQLLSFKSELKELLKLKPDLKTLLLVFNPIEIGLLKDKEEVSSILKEKGIELLTVEVFQTNEFLGKVTPFINKADAMLVLKDNTVVTGLDALVKLCNQHHIPLMTSDLDSPNRGAALGFGVHEIEFGIEGAKKALQILEDHTEAGAIPITPVSNFILKINSAAALLQGIDSALIEKEGELP